MSKIRVEKDFSRLEVPFNEAPLNGLSTFDIRTTNFDFLETERFTSQDVYNYPFRTNGMWSSDLDVKVDSLRYNHGSVTKSQDLQVALGLKRIPSAFGPGDLGDGNMPWQGVNNDVVFDRNYKRIKGYARNKSVLAGNAKHNLSLFNSNEESLYSFSIRNLNLRDHFRNMANYNYNNTEIGDRAFGGYWLPKTSNLPSATTKYNYFNIRHNPDTGIYENEYLANMNIINYVRLDSDHMLVIATGIWGNYQINHQGPSEQFNRLVIKNTITNETYYDPTYGYTGYHILKLNLSTGRFVHDFQLKRSNGDFLKFFGQIPKIHVVGDSFFIESKYLPSYENPETGEETYVESNQLIKFDMNGVKDETFFNSDDVYFTSGFQKANDLKIFKIEKGAESFYYFCFIGNQLSSFKGFSGSSGTGSTIIRCKLDGTEATTVLDSNFEIPTRSLGSIKAEYILDATLDNEGNIVLGVLSNYNSSGFYCYDPFGGYRNYNNFIYFLKYLPQTESVDVSFGFNDYSEEGDLSVLDFKYMFGMSGVSFDSLCFNMYSSKYTNSLFVYGRSAIENFFVNPFGNKNEYKFFSEGVGGIIKLDYNGELDLEFNHLGRTLATQPKFSSTERYVFGGIGKWSNDYSSWDSPIAAICEPAEGELFLVTGSSFQKWNDEFYNSSYYGQKGACIKINYNGLRDKNFKYEIYSPWFKYMTKNENPYGTAINYTDIVKYGDNYVMFYQPGGVDSGIRLWEPDYDYTYDSYCSEFDRANGMDNSRYHKQYGGGGSNFQLVFRFRNPSIGNGNTWEGYEDQFPSIFAGKDGTTELARNNVTHNPNFDNSPSNVVGIYEFNANTSETVTHHVLNRYYQRIDTLNQVSNYLHFDSINDIFYIYGNPPSNVSRNSIYKYFAGEDYDEVLFQGMKDILIEKYTSPENFPDCVDYKISVTDSDLLGNATNSTYIREFYGESWLSFGREDFNNLTREPGLIHKLGTKFDTTVTEFYGETMNILPYYYDEGNITIGNTLSYDYKDSISKNLPGNPGDFIFTRDVNMLEWNQFRNEWVPSYFYGKYVAPSLDELVNDKYNKFTNLRTNGFVWSNYYIPKAVVDNYIQNEM